MFGISVSVIAVSTLLCSALLFFAGVRVASPAPHGLVEHLSKLPGPALPETTTLRPSPDTKGGPS